MAKQKKITKWSAEAVKNHVFRMKKMRDEFMYRINKGEKLRVYISEGNEKLGLIPNVSTIPVIDCPNSKLCCRTCYDVRHDCINKQCAISRSLNSAIMRNDMNDYFEQISAYIRYKMPKFMRYNIGGDILNVQYVDHMVKIAREFDSVYFLAFTKAYDSVNEWIDNNGNLPDNLKIIFSVWPGLKCDNKYNLPQSHIVDIDGRTTAPPFSFYCPGNCTNCCFSQEGCFFIKNGQNVTFHIH